MKISIENLVLNAERLPSGIDHELRNHIAAYCGVKADDVLSYRILRRSIDARKKPILKLLYALTAELRDSARPLRDVSLAPAEAENGTPRFECARPPLHPVVVGAGPSGLFCALVLAMAGCKPLVLERGRDVVRRKADIDTFFQTRFLNEESNLLFGEGGAGTWSDGKLYTRVRDPRIGFILQEMIEAGAAPEIAYFSHPHLGSDRLPGIIEKIRNKIVALGGTFRWDARAESLLIRDNLCGGVVLGDGEKIEAPFTVVASGHSARELILSLIGAGVKHSMKGFQIGCRIEHPQAFVNFIQYGLEEPPAALGSAEYSFVSRPAPERATRGATTFCMCPGGEIIPATPKNGRLCTNGMSNAARSGKFANSAIVTGLEPGFFGSAREAFDFLDKLEKDAFVLGGEDYTCPAQNALDFMRGTNGKLRRGSSWHFGVNGARLDDLMPGEITRALRRALAHFDNNAPGFIPYGILTGVETRVSSPVRFERSEETLESSVSNLYLAGEGAGMAGGIVSSAADGIRMAEAILKRSK